MSQAIDDLLSEASEGSERLDALVWNEVDQRPLEKCGQGRWGKRDPEDTIAFDLPPRFTRSLDAVRTLKPEGWSWGVTHDADLHRAHVWVRAPGVDVVTLSADGATEDLAACRAFLKARQIRRRNESALLSVLGVYSGSAAQVRHLMSERDLREIQGFRGDRCERFSGPLANGVHWRCGDRAACPNAALPEHIMSIISSTAESPSPRRTTTNKADPSSMDGVDWHAKRVEVSSMMAALAAIEEVCAKAQEWSGLAGLTEGHMKALALATSEAVVVALQKDNAIVPKEPSHGRLVSMAMRADHAFCAPQQVICGAVIGLSKAERDARLAEMRKVYEEAIGCGFYSPIREKEYVADLEAANADDLDC